MIEAEHPHSTVDGDEAITSLIRLGLVEMVMTDAGPGYRIVSKLDHPNAALRARLRPSASRSEPR